MLGISLLDVIQAGLLVPPLKLFRHYKGHDLEAELNPDGTVSFQICPATYDRPPSPRAGSAQDENGGVWSRISAPRLLRSWRPRLASVRIEGICSLPWGRGIRGNR